MKKAIKFIYAILMLWFNPLCLGSLIGPILLCFLNKLVYNVYPNLENFDKYYSWVWNPITMILSMVLYYALWQWIRKKMETIGWEVI
jgi:hypothetical protein